MKIIVLAAGENHYRYFRRILAKPKCLYSFHGKPQILRILENIRALGLEENTRIVVGYKAHKISKVMGKHGFSGELLENPSYKLSAIHSLRAGLEGINEDVCLCCADQFLDIRYWRQLIETSNPFALFNRDEDPNHFHLDCLKLNKSQLEYIRDDRYLSAEFLADTRSFLTDDRGQPLSSEKSPPPDLKISSGLAMGYMLLDIIRRTCGAEKITEVSTSGQNRVDILTIPDEACRDLDYFHQTDEYQNSRFRRKLYSIENKINRILNRLTQW